MNRDIIEIIQRKSPEALSTTINREMQIITILVSDLEIGKTSIDHVNFVNRTFTLSLTRVNEVYLLEFEILGNKIFLFESPRGIIVCFDNKLSSKIFEMSQEYKLVNDQHCSRLLGYSFKRSVSY